jgi:tetratricopeptide (TPR) repeat protein
MTKIDSARRKPGPVYKPFEARLPVPDLTPSRILLPSLTLAALILPATAQARVEPAASLSSYAQARAAASDGAFDQASAGFAAALAADPDNEVIAGQALTHAVIAGDWPLALRSARVLERRESMLPDARFLLVAEAFRNRDWRAAGRQIDAIEREQLFAFAVPVLRAWLAYGSRRGDPLSFLPEGDAASVAAGYAAEQRPLLLVAMRRPEGARLLIESSAENPRAAHFRIAAAATMLRRDRQGALALLQGDEAPIVAARELVQAGRALPGGIDNAAAGMAEVLVRLALDMHSQDLTAVASSFARIATWAAPENGQAWLIAAELFGQQDRRDTAVALLANVRPGDPYSAAARDQRIRLLVQDGEGARALAEAEAEATAPAADVADMVRLGDVLVDQDRPADAARAYARALELRGTGDGAFPEWALWLFRGGAHDQADDWPEARAALQRAYSLAPDQPLVLNYLGYAQLVRRENMAEAERLVREAHRLAPDNAAITDSLGWALYLKGELPEAIQLLEQAAEGEPADVEINEHLGDAYFTAGRRTEARFAWRAALVNADGADDARLRTKIDTGLTPQLAAR